MLDELLKHNIEFQLDPQKNLYDFIATIIMIILLYTLFIDIKKSSRTNKIFVISTILLIAFYINENLVETRNIKSIKVKYADLYNRVNTGDIYVSNWRGPRNFIEYILYFLFLAIYQDKFFTHVGIIYKYNQELYIIEYTGLKFKTLIDANLKSKVHVTKFDDSREQKAVYEKDYKSYYIYNTNLFKYINEQKLFESVEKYRDSDTLKEGLNCSNFIYNVLVENGVFKEKYNDFPIITPEMFLNPKNYKVNIKISDIPLQVIP
jgi:hypothetical protein